MFEKAVAQQNKPDLDFAEKEKIQNDFNSDLLKEVKNHLDLSDHPIS